MRFSLQSDDKTIGKLSGHRPAQNFSLAISSQLFVKPAQVAIASLENGTHLAKGGRCAVKRNARVQMMNDMHGHAHCADNAEQTFERPRVTVAAGFVARMMGLDGEAGSSVGDCP